MAMTGLKEKNKLWIETLSIILAVNAIISGVADIVIRLWLK
jgi:hypothetical protein